MLLSTAYLPPVSYFQKIADAGEVYIEQHEHFVKQTYRNRCEIYGANGVQALSVPLVHTHDKIVITEKKIAYKQNWQNQHWRSIESAYRNSPYFIYYADELKPYYETRYEYLFQYNTELLKTILKLLKIKTTLHFTNTYEKVVADDHRNDISPKTDAPGVFKPYTQVFSDKHGFKPNLSVLDLLCNQGPQATEFL